MLTACTLATIICHVRLHFGAVSGFRSVVLSWIGSWSRCSGLLSFGVALLAVLALTQRRQAAPFAAADHLSVVLGAVIGYFLS
jgi:hypothetical protein